MPSEEVKIEFVAYIDLIGYKELLKDKTNLDKVVKAINEAKDYLQIFTQMKENEFLTTTSEPLEPLIVSDGIMLHTCDKLINIFLLIQYISYIQFFFLLQGFLTRGAITVGEFYYKNDVLFSQAFVDAYHLEECSAKYPRVLLSKDLIDYIEDRYGFTDLNKVRPNSTQHLIPIISELIYLKKDIDSLVFIGYLDLISAYPDSALNVAAFLTDNLKNSKKINHLEKYIWLANYYNKVIIKYELNKNYLLNVPEINDFNFFTENI